MQFCVLTRTPYREEIHIPNIQLFKILSFVIQMVVVLMGKASMKNAIPSPLEWCIDGYNILFNKLLEAPLGDYQDSLKDEVEARNSITVIETNI